MKIFAVLFMFGLALLPARAATVELEWDDPDNVPGAVVRYGVWVATNGEDAAHVGSSITHEYEMINPVVGSYSVYVTAISAEGLHSLPSNVITFTVPAAPTNLRIRVALEASDDLQNWQVLAVHYEPEGQRRYFRAVFVP